MEFKKINENTIRCILTQEDMDDYDLDLDAFLTHSPKADALLKRIIEEAREELGYHVNRHGLVSMRLEVIEEGRISITFACNEESQMNQTISKYLKQLFPDVDAKLIERVTNQLSGMTEEQRAAKMSEIMDESVMQSMNGRQMSSEPSVKSSKSPVPEFTSKPDYYLIEFDSLARVIEYCSRIPYKQAIRSHIYKYKDAYLMLIERYRISDDRLNHMLIIACDFGDVMEGNAERLDFLKEHGELLIQDKAYSILKKIGS